MAIKYGDTNYHNMCYMSARRMFMEPCNCRPIDDLFNHLVPEEKKKLTSLYNLTDEGKLWDHLQQHSVWRRYRDDKFIVTMPHMYPRLYLDGLWYAYFEGCENFAFKRAETEYVGTMICVNKRYFFTALQ